jgi:hypothetical protein
MVELFYGVPWLFSSTVLETKAGCSLEIRASIFPAGREEGTRKAYI